MNSVQLPNTCSNVQYSKQSYYNLSSVMDSVCALSPRPFMDLWGPSYYKMTISLYLWESWWRPHWQGTSEYNLVIFSSGRGRLIGLITLMTLTGLIRINPGPYLHRFVNLLLILLMLLRGPIYRVEAYDVLQVMSQLLIICRHPNGCNSLRLEQLQNPDMFYAGQGLYP